MDQWATFDNLRARWESEFRERRLQRRIARDDLKAHAVTYAMVIPVMWLMCTSSGISLVWPTLITFAWASALAHHARSVGVTREIRAGAPKIRVRPQH